MPLPHASVLTAVLLAIPWLSGCRNDTAAATPDAPVAAAAVPATERNDATARAVAADAVAPPDAHVPYAGPWPTPDKVEKDGPEADLLVQFGDIDNFGYGFPDGFDPFGGASTGAHPYPFSPQDHDAPGTDRIMVVSGYTGADPIAGADGYTATTQRPGNAPVPLRLAFDLQGVEVKSAALQLFVDDFQAPVHRTRFRMRINGRELPAVADTLNALDQTGPIGKLLTLQLLPEQLPLLAGGRVEIDIDDPVNNAGDGYAFDFARLLVNPKPWKNTGTVRGRAVARGSGAPIAGVLVSASNTRQATTGEDGAFVLQDVPAGLVVVTGNHPDYLPDSRNGDLLARQSLEVTLELEPNRPTSESLARQLDEVGKVDLYGIYFDTGQATLTIESAPVLEQVRALLAARPALRVVVAGHTDAEGGDAHNLALSQRRAAAVVAWLSGKGIAADRLNSEGHGESRPVAGNDSAEGRALNRRVEIREAG